MKILIEDADEKAFGVKAGWYEMTVGGMSIPASNQNRLGIDLKSATMATIPMTATASSQLPIIPPKGHANVGDKYYRFGMIEAHDDIAGIHHLTARVDPFIVNLTGELEAMNHGYLSERHITDQDLMNVVGNPVDFLRSELEQACVEAITALAKRRTSGMFKKKTGGVVSTGHGVLHPASPYPATRTPSTAKQTAIKALAATMKKTVKAAKSFSEAAKSLNDALKKPKCKECGDSGEWTHMNGKTSPCSKGCKKP